jgi:hypothetical protein
MWTMRALGPALLVLLLPVAATAVDFTGQSRTYLQSREAANGSNLMPLYEFLSFKADDLGGRNVSFHFGGWLRYDLQDESFGKKKNSDLQYAYLNVRRDRGNAFLNLGRLSVNEGVASEQIDGAYARTDLRGGFGAAAFGGKPIETNPDNGSGDSLYGGRITHEVRNLYRIGFSYLKEKNNSTDFREEEGVDLWFRPGNKVELLGRSFYNALTSGWMQHAYFVTLGPFDQLRFTVEATQTNYGDYFKNATTNAFKFDPAIIDPNETLATTGGEMAYTTKGNATWSLDYKKYSYDIAGSADYYGGKLIYGSKTGGSGLGLHRMDGQTNTLKYDEARGYAYKKFGKVDITADIFIVLYDTAVNGVKNAYAAVLAGGYALTDRARLGADVEYARNPFFDKDVRGLVKLVYDFDFASGPKGGRQK